MVRLAAYLVEQHTGYAHQKDQAYLSSFSLSILTYHFLSKATQNRELLKELYINKNLSAKQIAKISGWGLTQVKHALKIHKLRKVTKEKSE